MVTQPDIAQNRPEHAAALTEPGQVLLLDAHTPLGSLDVAAVPDQRLPLTTVNRCPGVIA
jgi:hypothetical protein